ncbi:MAG: 50S ribosomal protein L9 [Eubacterium sp.]|nr:50S ribosomal protein L9 [Eubacterium sp.]
MKVILLQDVKTLGKKGDIVEVNQGYARNFVLPKKLGVEATPQNLNDLKLKNQNDAKVAAEQLAEAKALAERLEKASVTASIKVGEGGRAFGSISSKEIADLVKKQLSLTIDKKKIVVKEPIKGLGTSRVTVKLHPEVSAELTVNVVEDKK